MIKSRGPWPLDYHSFTFIQFSVQCNACMQQKQSLLVNVRSLQKEKMCFIWNFLLLCPGTRPGAKIQGQNFSFQDVRDNMNIFLPNFTKKIQKNEQISCFRMSIFCFKLSFFVLECPTPVLEPPFLLCSILSCGMGNGVKILYHPVPRPFLDFDRLSRAVPTLLSLSCFTFVTGQWRNFCAFVLKSCTVLSRRKR